MAAATPSSLITIRLPFPVPYYAQVASPEWVEAVFERGADPAQDPRWREWGTGNAQEYAYWCWRACGAVCVKMCVESLGEPRLAVMEWVRRGLVMDGYEVVSGPNGERTEIGWKHQALAGIIASTGLQATARPATIPETCRQLADGNPVIASVSFELGTDRPVTQRGGHLVVVTGADIQDGDPLRFYLHNPSGRTQALREGACIESQRFAQAFSGRIIIAANHSIAGNSDW